MKKVFAGLLLLVGVQLWAANHALHVTVAGRAVAVWKPMGSPPPSGFPVILFSHGFGGCNIQSEFLMDALANDGYLVVAPNHKDARCGAEWRLGPRRRPEQRFRDYEKWTDAVYRNRLDDMEAVLDGVLAGGKFEGVPVDKNRVGTAGHSLGGYTVLGMGGAWPSWKDKRIKAVLALSPYTHPYMSNGDLGHMNVPVMYQGGTRDIGVTPFVKRSQGAYDKTSSPKYYVEFEGANHFAWTVLVWKYQEAVNSYSLAFFNHYLKSYAEKDALTLLFREPKPKDVSDLRFEK